MASNKPSILLLHGAFSTPAVWNKLIPYLQEAGFPTLTATFPSSNPQNPYDVTAQNDVDHVRNEYLLPLVDKEHKEIILIVHSYAGVVGSGAAVGLSRTARSAQGREGGVVGLICIAANLVHEDHTLIESAGGQWPPWLKKDTPHDGVAIIDPLMETLCHDYDLAFEPEVRKAIAPQGYICLDTKAPAPCWAETTYSNRLAFIRTIQDKINPAFAQDLWLEGTGVQWDIISVETSHAPFLSQPEKLTEHIVDLVQKFEAL